MLPSAAETRESAGADRQGACRDPRAFIPESQSIDARQQAERFAQFRAREHEVQTELRRHVTREVRQLIHLQLDAAERHRRGAKALEWSRKAADTLGVALAPIAACGRGCNACCHQPVMLFASEARQIGKEIGRVPKVVPLALRERKPNWRGAEHPCQFLRNGECSIYAHRPMACRLLFNMDRDSLLCEHADQPSQVPYFNAREIELRVAAIACGDPTEYLAEMNDFFQTGLT